MYDSSGVQGSKSGGCVTLRYPLVSQIHVRGVVQPRGIPGSKSGGFVTSRIVVTAAFLRCLKKT